MSAQDYESYTGAAKFVATQIGKLIGGNIGQAYAGFWQSMGWTLPP